MKDYIKPEVEAILFATEVIADTQQGTQYGESWTDPNLPGGIVP